MAQSGGNGHDMVDLGANALKTSVPRALALAAASIVRETTRMSFIVWCLIVQCVRSRRDKICNRRRSSLGLFNSATMIYTCTRWHSGYARKKLYIEKTSVYEIHLLSNLRTKSTQVKSIFRTSRSQSVVVAAGRILAPL